MTVSQRQYVVEELRKMTQKANRLAELLAKKRDLLSEQIRICNAMEKQRKEWNHV